MPPDTPDKPAATPALSDALLREARDAGEAIRAADPTFRRDAAIREAIETDNLDPKPAEQLIRAAQEVAKDPCFRALEDRHIELFQQKERGAKAAAAREAVTNYMIRALRAHGLDDLQTLRAAMALIVTTPYESTLQHNTQGNRRDNGCMFIS